MVRVRTKWIALAGVAAGVVLGVYWGALAPDMPSGPSIPLPADRSFPEIAPAPQRPRHVPESCAEARFADAARRNAFSLRTMPWAPFRRPEIGWQTYAVMIGAEIQTGCPPGSEGFAGALARWQAARSLPVTGEMSAETFTFMKGVWQEERSFVRRGAGCPDPPAETQLTAGRPGEGYSGKQVQLTHGAFDAYRRMVEAAKAEDPRIAADPRNLTIFSAYRSPAHDDERCARERNCNGIVRAKCSPHRTGRAADIYVGQAPGYGPDSSADPNRLYMTQTPTYQWLVANAHRFGFVPYVFEPWHWEWIGDSG